MRTLLLSIAMILGINSPLLPKDRVMSLDYCADQFLLSIADKEQIIGVSTEARDPHSFHRLNADGIPQFRADADQILTQNPSLVIRSWAGDKRLLTLLDKLKIPVISIEHFEDPKDMQSNVMIVANALGQQERGKNMIADAELRLERLRSLNKFNVSALYLTPGAYTTGSGTFANKVMLLSGIDNIFSLKGYNGWFPIPMELLVINPPKLIVTSFYDSKSSAQNHWGIARHSYIRDMINDTSSIDVPGSMMACSGLFIVDAAEHLRKQMDELIRKKEMLQ